MHSVELDTQQGCVRACSTASSPELLCTYIFIQCIVISLKTSDLHRPLNAASHAHFGSEVPREGLDSDEPHGPGPRGHEAPPTAVSSPPRPAVLGGGAPYWRGGTLHRSAQAPRDGCPYTAKSNQKRVRPFATPRAAQGKPTPLPEATPRFLTHPAHRRNEPPHVARSTHTEERGPQPLASAAPLSQIPAEARPGPGRNLRSALRAAFPHPARARTSAGPSSARRPHAASSRHHPAPPWLRRTAPTRRPTRLARGGPDSGVSWAAAPPGGTPLSLPPCGAGPYLLPLSSLASPCFGCRYLTTKNNREGKR